jgi:hypothetical protein
MGMILLNALAAAFLTTTWFLIIVVVTGVVSLGIVVLNGKWLWKNKGNGAWKLPGMLSRSPSAGSQPLPSSAGVLEEPSVSSPAEGNPNDSSPAGSG